MDAHESQRCDLDDRLWNIIATPRSADCIKDAFRWARQKLADDKSIFRARYNWYCGLFWSGAEYDIILYDRDGKWYRYKNTNMLGEA